MIQKIKLIALCTVSILAFGFGFSFANIKFRDNSNDFKKEFVWQMIDKTSSYSRGKKELIQNFCNFVTNNWLIVLEWWASQKNPKIYDPKQSAFLFFVCNNVWDYPNSFKIDDTQFSKYLKKSSFDSLGLICESIDADGIVQPTGCVPGCESNSRDMDTCDFNLLTKSLMTQILNDHSNMALGLLYWDYADKDIDNLPNDLAFKYFGGMLYNDKFPEYPQTQNYVKKYIKQAREISAKTNIIDSKEIIKNGNKKTPWQCDSSSLSSTNMTHDILACNYSDNNFFSDNWISLIWFVDASYNEIFRYNLFGQYYIHLLLTEKSLVPMKMTENPTAEWSKLTVEAQKFDMNLKKLTSAMHTNIKTLTNLQATFRVHIWFKIYYEEVVKFRNALAKIYTPLHQLYYKLRNVQSEK